MAQGNDLGQTGRGDGRRAAHPGRRQRLDDADQEPHRHAFHRHPHAGGSEGLRTRPQKDRGDRQTAGNRSPADRRHEDRLRRAGDGRLLPRYQYSPRRRGPLRPDERRRGDVDRVGHRRREHLQHRRGERALPHQPAVCARAARRSGKAPARARPGHGRSAGAAGSAGRYPIYRGSLDDQKRGRPARGLRYGRYDRQGYRRLCRGGQKGSRGEDQASAGLHARLERPVRVHAAGQGTSDLCRPAHPGDYLRPSLLELSLGGQDSHRPVVRPLCPGGQHLAAVFPRL